MAGAARMGSRRRRTLRRASLVIAVVVTVAGVLTVAAANRSPEVRNKIKLFFPPLSSPDLSRHGGSPSPRPAALHLAVSASLRLIADHPAARRHHPTHRSPCHHPPATQLLAVVQIQLIPLPAILWPTNSPATILPSISPPASSSTTAALLSKTQPHTTPQTIPPPLTHTSTLTLIHCNPNAQARTDAVHDSGGLVAECLLNLVDIHARADVQEDHRWSMRQSSLTPRFNIGSHDPQGLSPVKLIKEPVLLILKEPGRSDSCRDRRLCYRSAQKRTFNVLATVI